ncbi:MAG: hypothetical protein B7Z55_13430, partial [Planctomycetales bacterium 12-60-4]
MPRDVNAVMWIDVAGMYETPLARKEQWAKKSREAFQQQNAVIPPGVKTFLCCAELDFADGLRSLREFVIAQPTQGMTLSALAALGGAELSPMDGKTGVLTPRGVYIVEAEPNTWLAVSRGGRQTAGRWLQAGPDSSPGLDRLRKAVSVHQADHQAVLAFDLFDTVSPIAAKSLLATLEAPPSEADATAMTTTLSSLTSATLSVRIDNEIHAHLEVTFGESSTPLQPVIENLVSATLNVLGASGSTGDDWKWLVKGNGIVGDGRLSPAQLRRIFSIVYNPAANISAQTSDGSGNSTSPTESPVVTASRKYYRSVRSICDDLQDTLKKTKDNHALWYERSGRKIDDLPLVNVDPDLLSFGQRVSNSLRYQGQAQRVMNVRAGAYKAQTGAGNMYRYGYVGPYGGWAITHETPVSTNAIDKTANQQAMEVRFSEWKQIEDG